MLLIPFKAGPQWYAIDAAETIEVVPFVSLRKIPRAPSFIAGVLDYHGKFVPVVDMGMLLCDTPSPAILSTRIIIATCRPLNKVSGNDLVGLLARRILDTTKCSAEDLSLPCATAASAPCLGKLARTEKGLLQIVTTEEILPESVRRTIFSSQSDIDSFPKEDLPGRAE